MRRHVRVYVRTFPKSIYVRAAYALLLRARKERGFSTAVQFSFAITGREREGGREEEGGEKRKFPHKARPVYSPLFFKGSN